MIACGPCALDRSQRGGELAIIARDVTVTAGSAGAVHAAKPAPLSMSMSRAALVVALRADLRHGSEEQAGVEVQACEVVVCCGSCRAESMRDQDPRRRFQRVHRRHASRQHIRRCGHWGYMSFSVPTPAPPRGVGSAGAPSRADFILHGQDRRDLNSGPPCIPGYGCSCCDGVDMLTAAEQGVDAAFLALVVGVPKSVGIETARMLTE